MIISVICSSKTELTQWSVNTRLTDMISHSLWSSLEYLSLIHYKIKVFLYEASSRIPKDTHLGPGVKSVFSIVTAGGEHVLLTRESSYSASVKEGGA